MFACGLHSHIVFFRTEKTPTPTVFRANGSQVYFTASARTIRSFRFA